MNKILGVSILFAMFFILTSCYEEVKPEERNAQYIQDIKMPKKELYKKILEWMAKSYNSSKEVIQLQDEESGQIIGKGITSFVNVMVEIPCEYTITIDIKDNKYRLTFDNFIGLWGQFHQDRQPLIYKEYIDDVKKNIKIIADNLYKFLQNKESKDF